MSEDLDPVATGGLQIATAREFSGDRFRRKFPKRLEESWHAGRDSNPRPSGSKYHPTPRKNADLRSPPSTERHTAAQSGRKYGRDGRIRPLEFWMETMRDSNRL